MTLTTLAGLHPSVAQCGPSAGYPSECPALPVQTAGICPEGAVSALGRGTGGAANHSASAEAGLAESGSSTGGNLLAKAYARWRAPILRGLARVRGRDAEDALHDGAVKWIAANPSLASSDQQGAYLRRTMRRMPAIRWPAMHHRARCNAPPSARACRAGV
ncbi:hypothetical protein G6F63_015076 [Rhizopus arrhizus]|nr:hypothetical protein G6F63_015076 [Rhizopus arrhizus]